MKYSDVYQMAKLVEAADFRTMQPGTTQLELSVRDITAAVEIGGGYASDELAVIAGPLGNDIARVIVRIKERIPQDVDYRISSADEFLKRIRSVYL